MRRCPIWRPISRGIWRTGPCWPRRRAGCTERASFSAGTGLAALGTAAGAAFLVLSGVTVWSLSARDSAARPKLTEKDTIVLADFDNKTGDPVFEDTLRQGLSVELQQSPYLALISDSNGPADADSDGTAQRRQADSGNRSADLRANRQRGCPGGLDRHVLEANMCWDLRARNCNTGNILDQQQVAGGTERGGPERSQSRSSRKFRTRAGESLATVEKHSTPLAEATTSSIEALKAYSTAAKLSLSSGQGARPYRSYRRAVEIDPKFAMAHAQIGARVQRLWRVGAVGRVRHESLAAARSRQRSGEVLHRLHL